MEHGARVTVTRTDRAHRRRWVDRSHPRRVQAGDGHVVQGRLGIPPAADLVGEHGRAALHHQPQRQPAFARRERRRLSTKRSRCAGAPAAEDVLLRGDTDFTMTAHLDRWDDDRRAVRVRVRREPRVRRVAPRTSTAATTRSWCARPTSSSRDARGRSSRA